MGRRMKRGRVSAAGRGRGRGKGGIRGGVAIERLEPRVVLAAVGPDGYGYLADAATFENISLTEGAAGVTKSRNVDLASNTLNLYGRSYTGAGQVFANSQGLISFGSFSNSFNHGSLGGAPFQRALAPMWSARGFNVLWKLEDTGGSAAADRLVIQYDSPDTTKFQAILQLNTGAAPADIVFNYVDLTPANGTNLAGSSTVGIKDAGYASNRLLVALNETDNELVAAGKAVRIHNTRTGQPRANPVAPTVDESPGVSVSLDGSGSTGSGLTYAWDFDTDGIYGETGSGATNGNETGAKPTLTAAGGLNGPATFPVVLRVTDSNGVSSYEEAAVVVKSVLPVVVSAVGPDTATVGVPISYTVTGSDAFPADIRGVSVYWDDDEFGDQNEVTSNVNTTHEPTFTFSHTYNQPGTYDLQFYAYQWDGINSEPLKKTITVTAGADVQLTNGTLLVSGTTGNDTVTLDSSNGNARLSRNGTVTTYPLASVTRLSVYGLAGDDTVTLALDIPSLVQSGDGNDTVTTAGGADTVNGGAGVDAITTNAGNDSIDAGDGNDSILAGDGDDLALGGNGNNTIHGGAGVDSIGGGTGNDSIDGGTGASTISGNGGNDFIRSDGGLVQGGDQSETIVGGLGGGRMEITAGKGNDSITTGGGNDKISSTGGNPTVNSGGGSDEIFCGGEDATTIDGATIDAGPGRDDVFAWVAKSVFGGAGDDTMRAARGTLVYGGDGNDVIGAGWIYWEETGIASVLGGDGDDVITASRAQLVDCGDGNDFARVGTNATFKGAPVGVTVLGGDGDDNLFSNDGRDSIYGGAGRDTLHGGNGSDLLSGGGGNDKLFGQGGNDRLYGGAGNDRLDGQGGNDRLVGAAGTDTLNGGNGTDASDDDALDVLTDVEGELV
ncbi:MAG TPA: hypothetical protein VER17_06430 [Tepidisphaeraceae bacterium]|nr:hypothetical protein [Tepidisphaeraceae bacterium]